MHGNRFRHDRNHHKIYHSPAYHGQVSLMENHLFQLKSKFRPNGDQEQAIEKLVEGLNDGFRTQVLLGVTGSGKTS